METRWLNDYDYDTLVEWWMWFRFPPPPKSTLPDNGKCGVMVTKDGVEVCAGFLYFTNSNMCWMEYIVSNPNVKDKNTRNDCIKFLIDKLSDLAEMNGFTVVYTSTKNENLINKYLDCGFFKGSENCTEMIKITKNI
jgi:hypothetical protein